MRVQLFRTKLLSLMMESWCTKIDEARTKRFAGELRLRERLARESFPPHKISKMLRKYRVNRDHAEVMFGKKLPSTIKAPNPEWLTEHEKTFGTLRHFRTHTLRKETRAHFIAYGFLRGRQFRQIEAKSYEYPPWVRAAEIAAQYSDEDGRVVSQRFSEWRDAAGLWVHPIDGERAAPKNLQSSMKADAA